jgi:hypothetical protein
MGVEAFRRGSNPQHRKEANAAALNGPTIADSLKTRTERGNGADVGAAPVSRAVPARTPLLAQKSPKATPGSAPRSMPGEAKSLIMVAPRAPSANSSSLYATSTRCTARRDRQGLSSIRQPPPPLMRLRAVATGSIEWSRTGTILVATISALMPVLQSDFIKASRAVASSKNPLWLPPASGCTCFAARL